MNRQEFFRQLEYALRSIPENERMDALAYYNDYFDEAGIENEQKVIQELGSPQAVAQSIISDYNMNHAGEQQSYDAPHAYENPYESQEATYPVSQHQTEESKKRNTARIILLVILLVLASPVWLGVLGGLFGGLVGILGGLIGSGIGMLVGGIALVVTGVALIFTIPLEGVTMLGIGALLSSLSVLIILLFVLLVGKWIPKLVQICIRGCKRLFCRQEGGDEI